MHAIDVARAVLRTCQQLHGAAGVCDEYDISVLTRMVQPALRLPWSAERTAAELAAAIQRDGFDGLFAHGGARRVTTFHGPPLDGFPGIGALTMGGFLDEVADRFGPNEALVFDDPLRDGETVRWTYADLHARGAPGGARPARERRRRGRRASAILMGNRPEAVAALFGVALAGGVAVPLSTFAPKPELAFMLERADIRTVLTQERLLKRVASATTSATSSADRVRTYLRRRRRHRRRGTRSSPTGVRHPSAVDASAPPSRRTTTPSSSSARAPPASRRGCSTPTGRPTLQFWVQAQIFGRHEHTRMWSSLPMFWTAGLNTAMGSTLAAGGCWVMQETFEPGEALALMARERVTEPYTLPHQTGALEEHPDWATTDLSSLTCVYGKSAFARHPSVHGRHRRWRMPVGLRPVGDVRVLLRPLVDARRATRWPQSMGRLLPGNELRVVDPDTGRVLGAGRDRRAGHQGPDPHEALPRQGARRTASTPTASSTPATPAPSTPTATCTSRAAAPR